MISITKNAKNILIRDKFIYYLGTFALLLIFLNTSSIYSYYFKNISNILLATGSLITILLLLSVNKLSNIKSLFSILLIIAMIAMFGFCSKLTRSTYWLILKIIVVFTLIDVFSSVGIRFYDILFSVLKIFAVWALLNHFLFYTNLLYYLPVTGAAQRWKTFELYSLLFFENDSGISFLGCTYVRMSAPFSEPGVLAVFLNMGLFIALWLAPKGRKNTFWIIFFLISLLLCFSTWGLIILGLQLSWFFIKNKNAFVATLFVSCFTLVALLLFFQKRSTFSFYDRFRDLPAMLEKGIKSLPFGTGLVENEAELVTDPYTGIQYTMYGNYTGLLYPFVAFGLGSIYYYYLCLISVRYFTEINNINIKIAIALSIVFFGCLLTEPLALSTFYLSLLCNGIHNKNRISHKSSHFTY